MPKAVLNLHRRRNHRGLSNSHNHLAHREVYHRRLRCEMLEDRRLLNGSGYFFSQYDPSWQSDPMIDQKGVTFGTIGKNESLAHSDPAYWGFGCAMTDVTMLLKYYGMNTDPHQFNEAHEPSRRERSHRIHGKS